MTTQGNGPNITHEEIEFCAEDEKVEIIPNFDMAAIQILDGRHGPFRAQMKEVVPLWLAMMLKRRRRCTIITPEWMKLNRLDQVLVLEREQYAVFQELPFHYIEIAEIIIREAKDDIPDLHQVRERVRDIQSVRQNKILAGLKKITDASPIQLSHLAAAEVSMIRTFFVGALNQFHRQSQAKTDAEDAAAETARRAAAAAIATSARGSGAGERTNQVPVARQLRRT